MIETDVLILGGGLSGLAAASALGSRAIVLEREDRPGGLVRSIEVGDYWFDHVLHLLYFPDEVTEQRVRAMLGDDLQPCSPVAWVHSLSGCVRFPFQANLSDLPTDVVVACLADLAERTFMPHTIDPANYEEMLDYAFGKSMCEEFLYPYNRKMWRRPLDTLAAKGFHWNIARPDYRDVLRGAIPGEHRYAAYNSRGWYPRPPRGTPRGMECLTRALARHAANVRPSHEVCRIDLGERRVVARHDGRDVEFRYRRLISTLPLPVALGLMSDLPARIRDLAPRLVCNRVLSPCFCIRGPRPSGTGHWRYYADPNLCFTRLIFMHAFDPDSGPEDGWGLMAEIPERREAPHRDPAETLAQARADVHKSGVLPPGSEIVGEKLVTNEHGYVVFEIGVQDLAAEALAYLRTVDVEPLGRYGRWEYSSMAQVMRDGFAVGDQWNTIDEGAARVGQPGSR